MHIKIQIIAYKIRFIFDFCFYYDTYSSWYETV